MLTESQALRLIETTYRAAINPLSWQEVAIDIDEMTGTGGVAIHAIDEVARMSVPIGATGFDPSFLESYIGYYGSVSPWPAIFLTMPKGKARHSFMDIPEEDYIRTEFYQDWMRPQEDRVASMGVRTMGRGSRSIFATVNMRRRDRDRLEVPVLQMFDSMQLHFAHACAVNDEIAKLSARTMLSRPEAERSPLELGGIVIVTEERLLCWADAGAVALFGTVLRLTPIGRLDFMDSTVQGWLEAVITSASDGTMVPNASALETRIRLGERVLTVRALRCDGNVPTIPHLYLGNTTPSRAIALILSEQDTTPGPIERLHRRYGLSSAEAEVALRLTEGLDTEQIAALRGSSRHTVRNQIQSILWKMEARHRGEVILMISRLLAET